MRSITPVLIDYWHRLPASPVHQRRHNAPESCNRVREGHLPVEALLPFVLGDPDEDVLRGDVSGHPLAGTEPVLEGQDHVVGPEQWGDPAGGSSDILRLGGDDPQVGRTHGIRRTPDL